MNGWLRTGLPAASEVATKREVRRPMILGPEKEAARQAFPAPDFSYWLRPQNELPA